MENVVIIGAGPAGLTAGIYTSRAALNPLILTGMQPGGQLTTTTVIENFPGWPEGVDGNELMQRIQAQAEHAGARVQYASVEKIEKKENGFDIILEDKSLVSAKSVIIATGASAQLLDLPNRKELMGKGLSTCAVCDGFFYRNKKVAIVGGGDSALEEALYLSKMCSQVDMIVRRDVFRASKAMQEKVKNHEKIRIHWNSQIKEALANEQGLTGIVIVNKEGQETKIDIHGLFMAIGHIPNTSFLKGVVELDDNGYILTHEGTKTSVPGIFAAGDVEDKIYRQAITSCGRGAQAALQVEKFVEGME